MVCLFFDLAATAWCWFELSNVFMPVVTKLVFCMLAAWFFKNLHFLISNLKLLLSIVLEGWCPKYFEQWNSEWHCIGICNKTEGVLKLDNLFSIHYHFYGLWLPLNGPCGISAEARVLEIQLCLEISRYIFLFLTSYQLHKFLKQLTLISRVIERRHYWCNRRLCLYTVSFKNYFWLSLYLISLGFLMVSELPGKEKIFLLQEDSRIL